LKTWEEIGREMGVPATTAFSIYKRAMRKLRRRNPGALAQMREMAATLEAVRRERTCGYVTPQNRLARIEPERARKIAAD
jgi:sigma-70-like protein